MTRIAIDEFITITKVRAQWTGRSNAIGESDFQFMLPAAAGDRLETVAFQWILRLEPLFRAWRPTAWRLDTVIVEDVWPGSEAPLILDRRLGGIPEEAGVGLPPQCTPLISWRTGEQGRANRGRTYWGQCTRDSAEDEHVIDPGASAVSNFAEAMLFYFTGSIPVTQPRFVIVSRWDNGTPIYPGAYSPVTTYFFQERFAVQRRRLAWDWRT